jgi:general secretion pathway protein A
VLTSQHREALNNLEYAIANRTGVTLLIGEAGTGKTTVIRAALERQSTLTHCVHLHNPALTRAEFVQMLAAQFSLSERARTSKTDLLLELEQLFQRHHEAGERTVLIVDEAQSLSLELLEEIRLLANTETNEERLLQVILAGQPELAERLNHQDLRQLKQRVALRCELFPLSDRETAAYVAGRIAIAGGVAARVFTREAVSLIHHASRGVPRTVSVLADNALLGGFAREQKPVDSAVVREVCRDFDLAGFTGENTAPTAPTPGADRAGPVLGPAVPVSVDVPAKDHSTGAGPLVTVPQVADGRGLFAAVTRRRRSFFGS